MYGVLSCIVPSASPFYFSYTASPIPSQLRFGPITGGRRRHSKEQRCVRPPGPETVGGGASTGILARRIRLGLPRGYRCRCDRHRYRHAIRDAAPVCITVLATTAAAGTSRYTDDPGRMSPIP